MAKIERFEDIEAWRKARELTKLIYQISSAGTFARDFGLRDQIQRASVSIMSNIAEGFERGGNAEFRQFLAIAKGSVGEVKAQPYVALDVGFISQAQFEHLCALTDEIGRLLGGLIKYLNRTDYKGHKWRTSTETRNTRNPELETFMLIDLQIHTIATPGHATWEPDALMRYATQQGVGVVAVTDHNTVAQVPAALEAAARYGVHCIGATELDTEFGGKLWHLLLYGIEPHSSAIQNLCSAVVERNARDAQEIVRRFRQQGHMLPSLDQIERPTVAAVGLALVRDGVVPPQPDVEDEAAGMGYILTQLRDLYHPVTIAEATDVAHEQGALAVLAHPGRSKGIYAIPATAADIAAMTAAGIDGVEALYAGHTPAEQQFYQDLAQQHDLLVTAGSDSHHPADGLRPRPATDCTAFLQHFGIL